MGQAPKTWPLAVQSGDRSKARNAFAKAPIPAKWCVRKPALRADAI